MAIAIEKLVPTGSIPSEHADVVLELAYLAAAADGRLDGAELEAYRTVVASVRGRASVDDAEVDALLDRFAGNVDHAEIEDRVRQLAPQIPSSLRETVFKIVVGLSLVDLDTNREEMALEDLLVEVLGLTSERADELTGEVYSTFDAGSD